MVMLSETLFTLLIGAVALERLAELRVARRNATWARARGGREYGRGHFPVMVALHTALLVACVAEVWLLGRAFVPLLGWPMLAVALGAQVVRWHVIGKLGPYWNTRVIVVPGMRRVDTGIYRYLKHPNYVAVVAEGVALPLVHTAWITALTFTVLNAALLTVRIRTEERALRDATAEREPGDTAHPAARRATSRRQPPAAHLTRSRRATR